MILILKLDTNDLESFSIVKVNPFYTWVTLKRETDC